MYSSKVLAVLFAILSVVIGKNQKAQPFFITDEDCFDDPNLQIGPHQDCTKYWGCDELGAFEISCEPGEIFDTLYLECGEIGVAICDHFDDGEPEVPEPPEDIYEECPLDSDEVIFITSSYCDEYYICINGRPVLFQCRAGQHWNKEKQYCDDLHTAGCDETATPHPPTLPDCSSSFVGTIAHPDNCNWFIYCERGSRSIQQCQHLFHFDVNLNRCVFMTQAKCVKDL